MKLAYNDIKEELNCTGNGYKPPNLHKWGPGVRNLNVLHYIISGKGYLETNQTIYTLKAGDSFIIYPQMEVCYYPDQQEPWEYIWVDFNGNDAIRLLSMTSFTAQTPVVRKSKDNLEPFFHIIETTAVRQFEKERHNAKLRLLLTYYMEYYPKDTTILQTDYVTLAKEYIENNYWKTTLMVSDIAEFIKIDRIYLFRLFKEATGMSVLNYLISYRIMSACTLLQVSELPIKSIAYSVGYQDQMYFSKAFKKRTNYSPSEYRELNLSIKD